MTFLSVSTNRGQRDAGRRPPPPATGSPPSTREPSDIPKNPLWVYAYVIRPPQSVDQLRKVESLLDDEHTDAGRGARTWVGRLIVDDQVTHILVVSDGPDQDRDVNRKLEAELTKMEAGFLVTAPLAVTRFSIAP